MHQKVEERFAAILLIFTLAIGTSLPSWGWEVCFPDGGAAAPLVVDGEVQMPSLSIALRPTPPFHEQTMTAGSFKPDFDFFKQKTATGIVPIKAMDDLSLAGLPVFATGLLIKGDKKCFRQDYKDVAHSHTRLLNDFHSSIDDKAQYFGPALTLGLKLAGVEGRSDWPRLMASAGMSYGIMAILVNSLKYTVKERRPDGSSRNSWPSGHTATSFAGATILHKEYGLTRSPWYSVAGYGVATATGVMRVLNNRHWVSDVFSGAGIGILSTELGYALSDILFKEKGLLRNNQTPTESDNASFLGISAGIGLGTNSLTFGPDDLVDNGQRGDFAPSADLKVDFRPATTIDAEGAYFLNKNIGVGGRLRVRAMTARNWDSMAAQARQAHTPSPEMPKGCSTEVVCDFFTDFLMSAGLYFNLPLNPQLAVGSKLLAGRSIMQEMDTDVRLSDPDNSLEDNDLAWSLLTLGGNRAATYGTGLSLTYHNKSGYVWKVFADFDYTKRNFTLTYDPYRNPTVSPTAGEGTAPYEFVRTKHTCFLTLGGTFAIKF